MRGHCFPTFKYCFALTMRVTSLQHFKLVWFALQMAIALGGWLRRRCRRRLVEEGGRGGWLRRRCRRRLVEEGVQEEAG